MSHLSGHKGCENGHVCQCPSGRSCYEKPCDEPAGTKWGPGSCPQPDELNAFWRTALVHIWHWGDNDSTRIDALNILRVSYSDHAEIVAAVNDLLRDLEEVNS